MLDIYYDYGEFKEEMANILTEDNSVSLQLIWWFVCFVCFSS